MTASLPLRWVRQKPVAMLLALTLILGLAAVDYATGHEITLTPFYLLPICWVTWVAGRRAGLFLAVASAVAWLAADVLVGYAFPHRVAPYWNALMLLTIFVGVVYLLTAFHDAHLHLEDTVAQRTAALRAEIAERTRLEAAKIRSERLAVVGTMAAEMAHEVRNPLGSIALNLDLIQKEIAKSAETSRHAPEEAVVLVNEMRAEIRRVRDVLEDYLRFARSSKLQRRPLVLSDMLDPKLAFLHDEFERARVKLRTDLDPALPAVNADADQLWQAMLNLIHNSLEAMPDGGELTVSARHLDREAVLRVSDTGSGMTDAQVKRVFDPFFTTKSGGTGLGLALVHQIVSEHGGRVECESAPGMGSTFALYLPLAENS